MMQFRILRRNHINIRGFHVMHNWIVWVTENDERGIAHFPGGIVWRLDSNTVDNDRTPDSHWAISTADMIRFGVREQCMSCRETIPELVRATVGLSRLVGVK